MRFLRLLRSELRKLTTTKMPWAFVVVLAAIGAINASAVIWGTDFDGSKNFIATAADQRSMVASAANAAVIAGLFGAIAVSREFAHGTVIPMFLSALVDVGRCWPSSVRSRSAAPRSASSVRR